jgi:hypothetical protein
MNVWEDDFPDQIRRFKNKEQQRASLDHQNNNTGLTASKQQLSISGQRRVDLDPREKRSQKTPGKLNQQRTDFDQRPSTVLDKLDSIVNIVQQTKSPPPNNLESDLENADSPLTPMDLVELETPNGHQVNVDPPRLLSIYELPSRDKSTGLLEPLTNHRTINLAQSPVAPNSLPSAENATQNCYISWTNMTDLGKTMTFQVS